MDAQEIFDTVATHLLKQGKKSQRVIDGEMTCAYRGRGGTKCAVGVLIPDERYDRRLENLGVHRTEVLLALPDGVADYSDLLGELQDIHDGYTPREWRRRLRSVAESNGLASTVLEAA